MYRKLKQIIGYIAIILILIAGLFPKTLFALEERLTIRNIQHEIEDTNVRIFWDTNISSVGKIDFGLTSSYGLYLEESGPRKLTHSITLLNLVPDRVYHYKITVRSGSQIAETSDAVFRTKKLSDDVAPVITQVSVYYVTGTTATIQWITDKPATSEVLYGLTGNYGSRVSSSSKTTIHDVTLRRLRGATTYHFQVRSKDAQGNVAIHVDRTFQTLLTEEGERTEFEITNIRPLTSNDEYINETSATISWQTNKLADGKISYGTSDKLGRTAKETPPRDFFHDLTLTNLRSGTTYYFRISSKDVFGKTVTSPIFSFQTKGGSEGGSLDDAIDLVPSENSFSDAGDGLILYSSFDREYDADISAGRANAVLVQNPEITSGGHGVRGEALDASTGYLGYEAEENIHISEGTIALWFNPSWDKAANQNNYLFDFAPEYSSSRQKYFHIVKRGNKGLFFELEDARDKDYRFEIAKLGQVTNDNWHFVAVTWKYNGEVAAYFNGSLVNVKSSFVLGETPVFPSQFYLGSERLVSASALIDEFRIYNRVLSQTELDELYGVVNTETSRVSNPRILGASTFDFTKIDKVLREKNSPDIFVVMNGKKHYVSGPTSFQEYGLNFSQVKAVSSDVFNTFPYAKLLRGADNSTVYHIYCRPDRQWFKIAIPSPTVFISYPDNFWGDILSVNRRDIEAYPDARLVRTKDSSTVYLLDSQTKHPILSEEAFFQLGFHWPEVVEISQTHLDYYREGQPVVVAAR